MLHSPLNSERGTRLARAVYHSRFSLCSPIYSRESYFTLKDSREERLNHFRACKKTHRFYALGGLFLFSPDYQRKMVVSVELWPFSSLYEVNFIVSDKCIEMGVPHKVGKCCFLEAAPEGTKNGSNFCKYRQGCLQVRASESSTICLVAYVCFTQKWLLKYSTIGCYYVFLFS